MPSCPALGSPGLEFTTEWFDISRIEILFFSIGREMLFVTVTLRDFNNRWNALFFPWMTFYAGTTGAWWKMFHWKEARRTSRLGISWLITMQRMHMIRPSRRTVFPTSSFLSSFCFTSNISKSWIIATNRDSRNIRPRPWVGMKTRLRTFINTTRWKAR